MSLFSAFALRARLVNLLRELAWWVCFASSSNEFDLRVRLVSLLIGGLAL